MALQSFPYKRHHTLPFPVTVPRYRFRYARHRPTVSRVIHTTLRIASVVTTLQVFFLGGGFSSAHGLSNKHRRQCLRTTGSENTDPCRRTRRSSAGLFYRPKPIGGERCIQISARAAGQQHKGTSLILLSTTPHMYKHTRHPIEYRRIRLQYNNGIHLQSTSHSSETSDGPQKRNEKTRLLESHDKASRLAVGPETGRGDGNVSRTLWNGDGREGTEGGGGEAGHTSCGRTGPLRWAGYGRQISAAVLRRLIHSVEVVRSHP